MRSRVGHLDTAQRSVRRTRSRDATSGWQNAAVPAVPACELWPSPVLGTRSSQCTAALQRAMSRGVVSSVIQNVPDDESAGAGVRREPGQIGRQLPYRRIGWKVSELIIGEIFS